MIGKKTAFGPWRQDPLEPRIILDGEGEFFAIGISGFEASRIVASLNQTDHARVQEPAAPRPEAKETARTQEH